ncbi:MAG: 3'-5' exonuclease [Rickettsiales bacterium]|nr:3'-5' exonuclease [Rickettsiales bacterium]
MHHYQKGTMVYFDLETTGLSAFQGERVVSLAMIKTVNGIKTDQYYSIFNAGKSSTAGALRVHQISDAEQRKHQPISKELDHIKSFIGNATLIAHNGVNFDMTMLNAEFIRDGYPPITQNKMIDTLKIARNLRKDHPGELEGAGLDHLYTYLGLGNARATKHDALEDTVMLQNVYEALCQRFPDYVIRESSKQEQHHNHQKLASNAARLKTALAKQVSFDTDYQTSSSSKQNSMLLSSSSSPEESHTPKRPSRKRTKTRSMIPKAFLQSSSSSSSEIDQSDNSASESKKNHSSHKRVGVMTRSKTKKANKAHRSESWAKHIIGAKQGHDQMLKK